MPFIFPSTCPPCRWRLRNQVVETFANLIHENRRAGIIVTHNLRMCQYVDRVLHLQDGKLVRIYENKKEIRELVRGFIH